MKNSFNVFDALKIRMANAIVQNVKDIVNAKLKITKKGKKMQEAKTFEEFETKFFRGETPSFDLRSILDIHIRDFNPIGWFLVECVAMDSSRFMDLTILPYGNQSTYMEIPTRPISPRGLASDMSVVIMTITREVYDEYKKD